MPTALLEVRARDHSSIQCRTLLDTCSTVNFITENLLNQLKATKTSCSLTVEAMNELNTTSHSFTKLNIKSIHSNFEKALTFFVIPNITDCSPIQRFPREKIKIPSHLKLADANFYKPSKVDMLLGVGPTLSMFCNGQIIINNELILQKTRLGWIIGGSLSLLQTKNQSKCLMTNIEFDLERFWALEEIQGTQRHFSDDELFCEAHFKKYVSRNEEGRFVVALPFKPGGDKPGNSRPIAMRGIMSLKSKFKRDANLKFDYTRVINEYIELKHMSLLDTPHVETDGFYLPHHAVIKESSNTTKTRVVFNASAEPPDKNPSLNSCLAVGPTIQDCLFDILLRFRTRLYIIIADIEKMYRQFLIREEDRKYQKILWFHNNEIREYTLNTVTFGVNAAPYLAIRCLHQLAVEERNRFPLAAKIITKDMYVDNMLTGTNDKSEAREICRQMIGMLKTACLRLSQWASNDPEILDGIAQQDLDVNFDFDKDSSLKTLGIFWKAKTDAFVYNIKNLDIPEKITKRKILSEIAKIFDPIGFLGPIILFAKKLMQDIWRAQIDWDESIPCHINYKWNDFCTQLPSLNGIQFDRLSIIPDAINVEIHGFSDASQTGYGTCIYLRSINAKGDIKVSLMCSKSRVAPLKTRTIPQLELCAMQLLASLFNQVINAIDIKLDAMNFWSDSSIALNWINTQPNLLKTFVANRVVDIQKRTNVAHWRHVRTQDNPADALSRGQLPHEFLENKQWLFGPSWLSQDKGTWPESRIPGLKELPEIRKAACLLTINPHLKYLLNVLEKYSSFTKLVRIIAFCLRFKKKNREFQALTVDELHQAENAIIRLLQRSVFNNEFQALNNEKPLAEKNRLASLDPFIDRNGIIRVGGRIRKAIISFSKRHPIILPRNNHVTDLIIKYHHNKNFHTGIQNTLYAVRETYWIIDGRNQVKRNIRKCIVCFRANPRLVTYKMGNLPSVRVREARVFNNVGVDFCGPFSIKEKKHKNKIFIKCYVAIFVCMVVKAVHIEVVEDLSTESFLEALNRFTARRGYPETIYSDNGSNFRGAQNELNELYTLLNSENLKTKLNNYTTENHIEWHFIPPHAPNFGGLWEVFVKQFKHHFKRVAHDKRFTLAEFTTFAAEVEAILNSRPLTQMSTDINDLAALTPGHFLIGDSMRSLPELDYKTIPTNRLSKWEIIKKIKQEFWSRWHKEYLSSLNVRNNKNNNIPDLKEGLLVLIQEDNVPSMRWNLGRIEILHPGTDNVVRTVTIRSKDKLYKRPTTKIAILPIE